MSDSEYDSLYKCFIKIGSNSSKSNFEFPLINVDRNPRFVFFWSVMAIFVFLMLFSGIASLENKISVDTSSSSKLVSNGSELLQVVGFSDVRKFIGKGILEIYSGMALQNGSASVDEIDNKLKSDSTFGMNTGNLDLYFETDDFEIGYAEVRFVKTSPCLQSESISPYTYLLQAGISPESIEFARSKNQIEVFYDHRNKLKISVMCPYEGAEITVMLSRKYYMQ